MNKMRLSFAVARLGGIALVVAFHALTGTAHAGPTPVGTAFTYQGQLKQGGNSVNAAADLRFILYDAAIGGSQVGGILELPVTPVNAGLFTVDLDFGTGVFGAEARWLEIHVRVPAGGGAYATLSPRQLVSAAPYALYALTTPPLNLSNFPGGGSWALSSGLSIDADTLHLDAANNRVGIGTLTPATALEVAGTVRVTGFQMPTGANSGRVLKTDAGGIGTWQNDGLFLPFTASASTTVLTAALDITNTGADLAFGIRGASSSPGGRGVFGHATATSATNYGGYFETESTSGRGMYALADASTGVTYGVFGETDSSTSGAAGVYGFADASSGETYGVYGETDSSTLGAAAVHGIASATSGLARGGEFISNAGDGVVGFAQAQTGSARGVVGIVSSSSGRGVLGQAISGTGTPYAVRGESFSPNGFGVYSSGDFGGNGGKYFRIDHPFDPENKYLNHHCAEGPEPLLIYRGNITLDGAGEAWVDLPDYFEAINRDFHYHLTPIGGAAPNLHIAQKVINNSFMIAGGTTGLEISWTVTGVRNDPYMQQRRRPVIEDKPEHERGKYQHPELYNQPPEKGMDYRDAAANSAESALNEHEPAGER